MRKNLMKIASALLACVLLLTALPMAAFACAADANGDGKVTSSDARDILRKAAKLD